MPAGPKPWALAQGVVHSILSFLAVCPGLYFRRHYFILILPTIAVSSGIGASYFLSLLQVRGRLIFILLLLASILQGVAFEKWYFAGQPHEISRRIYGYHPFKESIPAGEFIKSITTPAEKIMVLGSEPEIYFYAQRRSASGYLYMYYFDDRNPIAEKMQIEMVSEIIESNPKYVVFVGTLLSWIENSKPESRPFRWAESFCVKNYELIKTFDIVNNDRNGTKGHIYLFERVNNPFAAFFSTQDIR